MIAEATASRTRIVIADDTALLRQGIARLLTEAGMEISGEAGDAVELMRLVEAEQPDVAIVDIRMPPTHTDEGLVAATTIRQRYPDTGVLVLSQYVDTAYVLQLLDGNERGCGYLQKDRVLNATELIAAIHRIAAGELVVDRELIDSLLNRRRDPDPLDELTDREREVLALMAEGLTDRGIGERLWISTNTVETHIRHILQKLDLHSDDGKNRRVQAVLITSAPRRASLSATTPTPRRRDRDGAWTPPGAHSQGMGGNGGRSSQHETRPSRQSQPCLHDWGGGSGCPARFPRPY